jgi:hypothetical protein
MSESLNVQCITIPFSSTPTGGTVIWPILKAPSAALGGGITILSVEVVPATATNDGTAWAVALVNGGTLGTVLGGTIAAKVGGTATASNFAANTIYPFTIITTSNINMLSAGQYLAAKITQEGVTDVPDGVMHIQYLNGR